jgi:hypothetical protein
MFLTLLNRRRDDFSVSRIGNALQWLLSGGDGGNDDSEEVIVIGFS